MVYVAAGVLLDVDTVRVEVTGAVPLIVTDAGLNAHAGAGLAPVIVLQDRLTLPVYPLTGVTVMVDWAADPVVVEPGFNALAASV
jgi:hypothetical protein